MTPVKIDVINQKKIINYGDLTEGDYFIYNNEQYVSDGFWQLKVKLRDNGFFNLGSGITQGQNTALNPKAKVIRFKEVRIEAVL